MLPSKLAAALMMPLVLISFKQARAQMIPVNSLPPEPEAASTYSASASPAAAIPAREAVPATATANAAAAVQLPPLPQPGKSKYHVGPFSTVALGLTASTLGPGVELATPLARHLNLRVGGNYVNLTYPFTIDGVNYNTAMKFTAAQALIDWFPTSGGFHLSVGGLYFQNAVSAGASVDPGQQFKLGNTTYLNSVDDPVQGTASLKFQRRTAPMVLLGFGNLIPRSGRHISVPFEFGGAYLAPPQVNMQLAGTACTDQGCFDASRDPTIQANLTQENDKLNKDIRPLQIYPMVSLGLAVRF